MSCQHMPGAQMLPANQGLEGSAQQRARCWVLFSLRSSAPPQPRRSASRARVNVPGKSTVDYIRTHFEVSWVVLDQSEVAILERQLIAAYVAKWELYNLSGTSPRLERSTIGTSSS